MKNDLDANGQNAISFYLTLYLGYPRTAIEKSGRKEYSYKAIYQVDGQFMVDHNKCDVCGDCYTICPSDAVEIVIEDPAR